ncbi:MAG: SHOCT domain-containing protein [Coriobacteriia bacterium]
MPGFAQTGTRMMGGYDGIGFHSAFGFGGMLFGLVVLAIVIGVIVWAVTRHKAGPQAHTAGTYPTPPTSYMTAPPVGSAADDAMRIARERLARGEIDVEQYSTIAQALRD